MSRKGLKREALAKAVPSRSATQSIGAGILRVVSTRWVQGLRSNVIHLMSQQLPLQWQP